jgi:hypothetical protein
VDSCALSAYQLFTKEVTDIKTHYSYLLLINTTEVSFMGFIFINILIYELSTGKHTTCTNG